MVLAFEFNYVSKNALLENILESICKDFDINFSISRANNIVSLYVKGDESILSDFSTYIGERLPLSIFFKSTAVNVVDEFKEAKEPLESCTLCVPFTPKTLLTSKANNLNPFINNEVGLKTFDAKELVLYDEKSILIKATNDFKSLYKEVSKLISDGNEVHIDSSSGSYIIGKLDVGFDKLEDFIVIPTDLSVVEKMVVIKDNEIKALASLEKPAIRLRVNTLYASKEILPSNRVKIKLPDELLLLNICENLQACGVDFIYKIDAKKSRYNIKIEGTFNKLPQIEVSVLENGEILILEGDGYCAPELRENLKRFDLNSHAQFASVVQEHKLFDKKISCFYISKTHDDNIMHLSEKTGMLDLIKFPVITDMVEIFDMIRESDTGNKLVNNYAKNFPDIYTKALEYNIPKNVSDSIYTIWGIAAVILGIGDNIKDGSDKIIENAEDFGGKKGPRVDYLLVDKESIKSDFDMLRLIRSTMSFKLAGTDDITLSFGMIEALAYFLSDTSDSCRENLSSEKTLLCGSMFGIKKLTEITCKNISSNSDICLNRELPIDN